MSYWIGMVIWFPPSVTALVDNTRPFSNVVFEPNVAAPGSPRLPTMIVPRNVLPAPIETLEAAPDDTQNTLLLQVFALPPKFTITLAAEVNAPVARKMYTPGVLKVRFEPTDIAPVTQCTPGASVIPPKSVAPA